jgi:hypothetical protein
MAEIKVVEKNHGIKELLFNPWNVVFLVFLTFAIGGSIPFTQACYDVTLKN